MKQVFGALVLGLSAISTSYAADLPVRSAPPLAPVIAAPIFTWTGFYVGVNGGYGWGDVELQSGTIPGIAGPQNVDVEADGFIGGAQAGYNVQLGSFVVGAEADIQYSGVEESRNLTIAVPGSDITVAGQVEGELEWFGTVRARLGYAIGTVLPYVTGGVLYGDVKGTASGTATGTIGGVPVTRTESFSASETFATWVVGAGVEVAFTPNVSFKGEYLYSNIDVDRTISNVPASAELDLHIVRAGVNYRF
jgi:outer membrane immunogenic protein